MTEVLKEQQPIPIRFPQLDRLVDISQAVNQSLLINQHVARSLNRPVAKPQKPRKTKTKTKPKKRRKPRPKPKPRRPTGRRDPQFPVITPQLVRLFQRRGVRPNIGQLQPVDVTGGDERNLQFQAQRAIAERRLDQQELAFNQSRLNNIRVGQAPAREQQGRRQADVLDRGRRASVPAIVPGQRISRLSRGEAVLPVQIAEEPETGAPQRRPSAQEVQDAADEARDDRKHDREEKKVGEQSPSRAPAAPPLTQVGEQSPSPAPAAPLLTLAQARAVTGAEQAAEAAAFRRSRRSRLRDISEAELLAQAGRLRSRPKSPERAVPLAEAIQVGQQLRSTPPASPKQQGNIIDMVREGPAGSFLRQEMDRRRADISPAEEEDPFLDADDLVQARQPSVVPQAAPASTGQQAPQRRTEVSQAQETLRQLPGMQQGEAEEVKIEGTKKKPRVVSIDLGEQKDPGVDFEEQNRIAKASGLKRIKKRVNVEGSRRLLFRDPDDPERKKFFVDDEGNLKRFRG